jgi:hypothetical protein
MTHYVYYSGRQISKIGLVGDPHKERNTPMTISATIERTSPPINGTVRIREFNPYTTLIRRAKRTGKRYVLEGRYSLTPYEGRKNACEAFTVMGQLHQAARENSVAVKVRRFDNTHDDCRIAFQVVNDN